MNEVPHAVMQPGEPVADAATEIINGLQKSLEDVSRAKSYLVGVRIGPRNPLDEGLLDRCWDRRGSAAHFYDLAAMLNQLANVERARVSTSCNAEDFQVLTLHHRHNMPPDEIARLLGSDTPTIESRIAKAQRDIELGVRDLFATRVRRADGTSPTWFEVRNKIQTHFREIRSLLADIQNSYGEYKRWRHDFQEYAGYEYEECSDPEQRRECYATGQDCKVCTLMRSEPYMLAARLIHDYDNLLAAHLDAVTELLETLMWPEKNHLPPMQTDLPDGLYGALEADVDRYIDTPEMSAANLRKNYYAAVIEDNANPLDGQTAADYTDICWAVERGWPHGGSQNLIWALHVMNAAIAHPALQVKALIMTLEQAKAASAARGMPII